MISFFTIPRQFNGLHEIIQSNAILSWKKLKPDCEILIFGNDVTVSEFCLKNNLDYIDDFESNQYGTPLLDAIWNQAFQLSSNNIMCYINSDIILFPDFQKIIKNINFENFLISGRRWDLDIDYFIDFNSNWIELIKEKLTQDGSLHSETGADFFLFPKIALPKMPPFAIGRTTWDNWLFYDFANRGIPIIDATDTIKTIHQNHDYNHIKTTKKSSFKGEEVKINKKK